MKKGYILIDIVIAFSCLLILSVPIFKTFNLINNNSQAVVEKDEIYKIMTFASEKIKTANTFSDLETYYKKDGYDIKIQIDKNFDELTYKYKVIISKNDKIKQTFFMYKVYKNWNEKIWLQ